MAVKKSNPKALTSGRPPFSKKTVSKQAGSSKVTRSTIRKHHVLLKERSKALSKGDITTAASIDAEITSSGGLEAYQRASQTGQMSDRGGDTSKVLVSWLEESGIHEKTKKEDIRVLEVGCLSPRNAISKWGATLTRIDLRSTHPDIQEQDFMSRPLPSGEEQQFEIVSLSLVINFVPESIGRGDMLFRTTKFLSSSKTASSEALPALFLTLPLPCVTNSRYLTESHLFEIMSGMGYILTKSKSTAKMYYSLWILELSVDKPKSINKKEVNPGSGRNNFCIVVR